MPNKNDTVTIRIDDEKFKKFIVFGESESVIKNVGSHFHIANLLGWAGTPVVY